MKKKNLSMVLANTLKMFFGTLDTVFKILNLATKPQKFLVRLIQFMKSRPMSILILLVSVAIVTLSSMDSATFLIKSIYPNWSDETIKTTTFRTVVFLEFVLVYLKVTRSDVLSYFVIALVFMFSVGSMSYETILNYEDKTIAQLIVQGMLSIPIILSTILMYKTSADASKIPKDARLDKAMSGKKKTKEKFSLTDEERNRLNTQIIEFVDFKSDSIDSFRSIQKEFQDRVKSITAIQNLLKKERPILFTEIQSRQKKGRKKEV